MIFKGDHMDTKVLEILVETVEHKSINKAAEQLGYTQSGLSYRLNVLEDELGIPLLERSRSGVHYTPEALSLLPYIRALLDDQRKFDKMILQLRGVNSKLVRIGTFPSLATSWLSDAVYEFYQQYPDVNIDLRIDTLNLANLLADDEVDFIFAEELYAEGFEWYPLGSDYMCLAVPDSHPFAGRKEIHLEELSNESLIWSSKNSKNLVCAAMEKEGIPNNNHFSVYSTSGDVLMQMVKQGFGLSYVASSYRALCPDGVVLIPISPTLNRSLGLVSKNFKKLSPSSKKLISILKKQLKSKDL